MQKENVKEQSNKIEHQKEMLELVDEAEWILVDKYRNLDEFTSAMTENSCAISVRKARNRMDIPGQ